VPLHVHVPLAATPEVTSPRHVSSSAAAAAQEKKTVREEKLYKSMQTLGWTGDKRGE
jgi:hypothetical protein